MKLKVTMWNKNGLGDKVNYIKILVNETKPDTMPLSETKMNRPIVPHMYVGDEN